MKTIQLRAASVLLTLAFALCRPAAAQVTQVGSRAALGSDLTVNWQEFGPDGSYLSTPVLRHFGQQKVSVASSSGQLVLRREGTTWHGDFVSGQYLLTQPFQSESFIVAFSPPVVAVGTQIDPGGQQSNQAPYTGRFVARLYLYDTNNNLLGMVRVASTANSSETGTARFIGARSTGAPIKYVTLFVSGVTPGFKIEGDLAANQMDVVTAAP